MNVHENTRRAVDDAVVSDLLRAVGRFRRQLRRSAPRSFAGENLSESQAEFLRLVGRQPGISVGDSATQLGLADNTASTLVSALVRRGLLVREADPADRRVGRLSLAENAQARTDAAREVRHAVIADALAGLDDATYAAVLTGAEGLAALTERLAGASADALAVQAVAR